jgi:hypothetical protein
MLAAEEGASDSDSEKEDEVENLKAKLEKAGLTNALEKRPGA